MPQDTNKNKFNNLFSDILIFIMGTVLAKAIQFILMPLYTSVMSAEAYGIAELTNNLSELFYPIATVCIYEAAFRFAVDPNFDNTVLARTIGKVLLKSLFIGFIVTMLMKYVFNYKYSYYLFFVLYSYSIRMCVAYYTRGKGHSKRFAISGVINAVSLSIFNILFLVLFEMREEGYLLSIGLGYCVSALYLLLQKDVINDLAQKPVVDSSPNILYRYCFPLIIYNVLYWFTTISGRYILMWFTDNSTAGKYVAAIKIAAVVNMIQQAIYAAFQLNSSKAFTEKGKEKYYSKVINLFITLYIVFGSIVISFTPILARITLKNEFYSARCYLPIIVFAALISCVSSLIGTMYSTYKKTKRMVGVSIVGALVNIIVGMLLCPIIGIWGICIASVLCYFIQTIYKVVDVNKFCKIHYQWNIVSFNTSMLVIQVMMLSLWFNKTQYFSVIVSLGLVFFNSKTIAKGLKLLIHK